MHAGGDGGHVLSYLIMKGRCDVLLDGAKIATLGALDVFGESALFPGGGGGVATRGGTVVAAGNDGTTAAAGAGIGVELLCLSKASFDALVGSGTLGAECVDKLRAVARLRGDMNAKTRAGV